MVRNIMSVVYDGRSIGAGTGPVAEIGDLIHVKPNSCKLYLAIQMLKHILPVLCSIRMKVIYKVSRASPDLPDEILSLS